MSRRIAVRAIIVKDGKLLAMTPKPYHEHVTVGIWFTVGGSLEDLEALLPALEREVIEETGVKPDIGNLLYVHQFISAAKEHLEFFFHVTNGGDYTTIDLSKTTHGETEIKEVKFIEAAKEDLYPAFLRGENFADLENKPVKFFSYLEEVIKF